MSKVPETHFQLTEPGKIVAVRFANPIQQMNMDRPAAAWSGSLIGQSDYNDSNNQYLKTIHNQANTKELHYWTITIRDNRATIPLPPSPPPPPPSSFSPGLNQTIYDNSCKFQSVQTEIEFDPNIDASELFQQPDWSKRQFNTSR